MLLSQLHYRSGAKKRRKRLGRGSGSGHGKTSCRGNKGLLSRSGGGLRQGFEGGQMPLIRRIPKRGFSGDRNAVYQIVNIGSLKGLKNEVISPEDLKKHGLIKNAEWPIKMLGTGEISRSVTVRSHAFSKNAIEKIEKAGGKIEIIKREKTKEGKKE